ncbi:PA0069 family radical SAM protein [Aquisalinus flavus]|uniref:Radical SAM protein n=1 Tax=Aquisalinus flavus TaxID=1526572 RepID=A0A8J2V4F9_9PROT|nr:PA0069 family radical SAM protein [Aquisalinus flavus]MBD0426745.1 PA0069 family radical SAM protein [Aquisalinus flavus]UNE46605.1 PA0069 family radical SAM protein [Aquisalinus flavus]GGC95649.1 radical SAM protein [Aquisalinus flavus]
MARATPLTFRPPTTPAQGGTPPLREKGRGARSNSSGRYESEKREEFDDGWSADGEDGLPEPVKTHITHETPRKIVTFNNSPYVGFDRSINPYRGCEHGCIYCFARPTHAYMGLSPGLDFETRLFAKPDADKLLVKELSHPNYTLRPIAIGTNTDAYQPIERHYLVMRRILGVLSNFNHPVSVLTKSDLIIRDLDILAPMGEKNLTRCMISITTEDRKLARAMEPRAPTPARRFDALKRLVDAGITTGIMTGPMIPGLNDSEMETIIEKAADAGATYCAYTILRLPLEVSPLFQEWLETFAPTRANRIMRHIREMNGGRDYDPHWSRGAEVKGVFAKLMMTRYNKVLERTGLANGRDRVPLDTTRFRVPASVTGQGDLFG